MKPLLLLAAVLHTCSAYKILIFSAPTGYSHLKFMGSIGDVLAEAGHEVHVLYPSTNEKLEAHVAQVATPVIHKFRPEFLKTVIRENRHYERKSTLMRLRMINDFFTQQYGICEELISNTTFVAQIRNEKYDVGISEVFGLCGFGIFESSGIPSWVAASSIGLIDNIGVSFDTPVMPSYQPFTITSYSDRMHFGQRFVNFFCSIVSRVFYQINIIRPYTALFVKYAFPIDFDEVAKKRINYMLVNTDEFVDFPRPESQKVVHIGGINLVSERKPLDQEFSAIINKKNSKGTILISFGTNALASNMPQYFKTAFVEMARQFPEYEFIWKLDVANFTEELALPNLHIKKWIPQADLLASDGVVCFVTHGGMNSVLETAITATPAVVIPLFADQFRNAAMLASRRTGIVLPDNHVTPEAVVAALREALAPEMATNARRISQMISDRKTTPRDRVLQAVEYTAKFGKMRELDIAGWKMSSIEYFSLDVIAPLLFVSLSLLYFIVRLSGLLFRQLRKKEKSA